MDFPAEPAEPAPAPDGLAAALGAEPAYIGRNRFDYLVEVDTPGTVQRLTPDYQRLGKIETRGFIVTARADTDGIDFVSRFFAPRTGVDEDPVTGSAHCCLGPYWQSRLGHDTFTARQVSERGGLVKVARPRQTRGAVGTSGGHGPRLSLLVQFGEGRPCKRRTLSLRNPSWPVRWFQRAETPRAFRRRYIAFTRNSFLSRAPVMAMIRTVDLVEIVHGIETATDSAVQTNRAGQRVTGTGGQQSCINETG